MCSDAVLPYAFAAVAVVASLAAGKPEKAGRYYAAAVVAAAAVAAAVALYLSQSAGSVLFLMGISALSCALAVCYMRHPRLFAALLLLLVLGFAAYVAGTAGIRSVGFFGMGSVCGLLYRDAVQRRRIGAERNSKRRETNRDLMHILLGVIVAAVLVFVALPYSAYAVFALILSGYALNTLFLGRDSHTAYGRALAALERSNTTYGIGAVYLAVGASLVIGFAGTMPLMLFGVAAVFFADPMATIVGIRFGRLRLPHSKSKTLEGTLSFFLLLALAGVPLIGAYALPLSAALAFLESLDISIDDNMRSGIAIALIGIALRL